MNRAVSASRTVTEEGWFSPVRARQDLEMRIATTSFKFADTFMRYWILAMIQNKQVSFFKPLSVQAANLDLERPPTLPQSGRCVIFFFKLSLQPYFLFHVKKLLDILDMYIICCINLSIILLVSYI